jgi:biopolymer transport protein ExbD
MQHAHKHHGADKVVTGAIPHASADMNVTPLIDVLLVLLIIFMAALPALRKSIDVQLPDPNPQVQPANAKSDQIVLEVNPGGKFFINSQEVDHDHLAEKIKGIYDGRPDKIIFVKGNPESKYGDIIEAMDIARGSGVLIIGVPPKDTPGSKAK